MFKLKLTEPLKKIAAARGIKIPASTTVNSAQSLLQLSARLQKASSVDGFVIPPIGISAATALQAAGQVLNQGTGSGVLINTQALAALGDKDAIRGLQSLMTARAIQGSGQTIPAPPPHIKPAQFKRTYGKSEVLRLAQMKTAKPPLNLWARVKQWFTLRF